MTTGFFSLHPVLTPQGHLVVRRKDGGGVEAVEALFFRGDGHGLLALGIEGGTAALSPALVWWRDFGRRFVAEIRSLTEGSDVPLPDRDIFSRLVNEAPPMAGAEYLSEEVLAVLWTRMNAALAVELKETGLSPEDYLRQRNPAWHTVGRVHFNLAENRKDEDWPFAFLATYAAGLSTQGRVRHAPLGQALREYAGADNRTALLRLLQPVQVASETCPWLKDMVARGEIYHPLRWTPQDAMRLLQDTAKLEEAGVVVRMPTSWKMNRPSRPIVKAVVGNTTPSAVGLEALLDFRSEVTLDGQPLTPEEIRSLLAQSDGLALLRGQWVEVDHIRLKTTLEKFEEIEKKAQEEGVSFAEAMRLLSGASLGDTGEAGSSADWAEISAGTWLADTLKNMRTPEGLTKIVPGTGLKATLRPYQQDGLQWLHFLTQLRLGACLADDMGLGKTIQVLSLLLVLKQQEKKGKPSLLVAPASLLSNWSAEAQRFVPSLRCLIAHPSTMPADALKSSAPKSLMETDLVITSYGTLLRVPWLQESNWRLAVLDEAQAIKNPGTKQTKAVKQLKADARLALTGTPIENRLGDLWSIFDFINPGLLGSAKQFSGFAKKLQAQPHSSYAPLRTLVKPYILRRMKTDKKIISDLPDKTEIKAWCPLSRLQAALYEQAVLDLTERLKEADMGGIARKGLVLSFLMRFKQICNHPSQWLGDNAWGEADSGKLTRLREIVETIAEKQEKVLVFTQFKETTAPLEAFLGGIFGRPGLVLHGETPVAKRKDLVRTFQEDESVPFFVLSLKAGGAGLNLTAASHVVHFDRWWNPAVENQATDRAFRIGQKKNVLVHKFVCKGTIEDKIDKMIEDKKGLARDFLEGGSGEVNLTEMSDRELLDMVALDLNTAMQET